MSSESRTKIQNRLKRIAGQVAGVSKMIDDERYCIDLLTQLAAIRSALDAVGVELLSDHVEHCVRRSQDAHPQSRKRSDEQLVEEMRLTLSRFLRS